MQQADPNLIKEALKEKNVQLEVSDQDLQHLRSNQPFILIANTAMSQFDHLALMYVMSQSGQQYRIVSRKKTIPESLGDVYLPLKYNILQVNDYLNNIYKHLRNCRDRGVSVCLQINFSDTSLDNLLRQQFFKGLAKVLRKVEMPIVPVRLEAPPGGPFLRNSGPVLMRVRIGAPISPEEQQKFPKPSVFKRYLQSRIYCLGSGLKLRKVYFKNFLQPSANEEPLAAPMPNEAIAEEIEKLKYENLVATQGDYDIFVARAREIPNALEEIGRLRELTFRSVGEGTGKARDLDEFDIYYRQLILWNRVDQRIAGGYRMGLGDEIFGQYGPEGFYISSLFKIKPCFYPVMPKSVELGRSYIVPEYQKQWLPLFLLWKGILYFLLKNPHYRYLYGPVSISKFYSDISRSLIVSFIRKYYYNEELARCLKPRKPFRFRSEKVDIELLTDSLSDNLKGLDNLIEDIEPDHIRLPVLVRQYIKLNARFISFNVDPNFSDVLDGFIILDLNDVPLSMIEALKRESQD
ncbi:MAG: hypothetical protein CMN32_00230 [Saprospirales bacterium]|nr:hypothetical protein [Saprospirales bacterium]